ncbi:hypothetical protein CXB77_01845 [Chromatium okenii]|uniref:DUF2939 domain-containing protein n=2 Tax=Chromatium okenii TaxID=61644 RepID=A0A2S7XUV1_9GAMM|nr:DUF2939 domain-containing protein [Chromatium okenii]PQJ97426.1 hypothetical protein CXB77_01845 [Chromatium okenii]
MRIFGYLVLLAIIGYGIWPYYTVYQLDKAIVQPSTAPLAELLDLPAIRANYKQRVTAGVKDVLPGNTSDPHGVMTWIGENLTRLGDAALDQVITPEWAQRTLRDAINEATKQTPAYLLAAMDFAFFESHNRFLIRIGDLGQGATHIRLSFIGGKWKITDIITSVTAIN